jgi:nitrate/nitrite transport system permease protein
MRPSFQHFQISERATERIELPDSQAQTADRLFFVRRTIVLNGPIRAGLSSQTTRKTTGKSLWHKAWIPMRNERRRIPMALAVVKADIDGPKGATVSVLTSRPPIEPQVVAFKATRKSLWADTLAPRLKNVAVNTLPPLLMVLVLMFVWQIAFSGPRATLPSPTVVWRDASDLILNPFFVNGSQDIGLGWRVLTSLERVAYGFGIAAVVGVLVGAVIGQSIWALRALDPIFQVLRTVPPLAWLPISLAAFRDANPSAIFVIFITAVWPILINTAVGIRNIPQDYRNVAQVLRLNQIEFFFKVMLPSAAPYIFTGLRIGIGLSWLAIIAAEMLTGGVGIGFFIWDAWNSSKLSDIIVALLYIGVIGFVLDRLVAALATFVTRGTSAN